MYFIENTTANNVIKGAIDSIGEDGYLSLFTNNYAALRDIDKFRVIDVILNHYQISITDFIDSCLGDYSKLYSTVSKELRKARKQHLADTEDELSLMRFKTWIQVKERLGLQKRLLIKCIIDHSAHLSFELDEELKNFS